MASLPRNLILHDECYFHITWQCHNKSFYFKKEYFKKYYYDLLLKYKNKYQIEIYSYCIMSNHFHLVGKCNESKKLSDFMRLVNSLFARHYNKKMEKRGQVCMDRFKSPLIQNDENLICVMRYLDMNPVKAKIIKHPKKYKYSSFRYYAYGEDDPIITEAPAFLALGDCKKRRHEIYLEMVEEILKDRSSELNMASELKKTVEKEKWQVNKMNKDIDYSKVFFIGDPEWVLMKYENIKKFNRESYVRKNSA